MRHEERRRDSAAEARISWMSLFVSDFVELDGTHNPGLAEHSPAGVGDRAGDRAAVRGPDERADLEPLGAERSAYITVDRFGGPRCSGGFCATVRDLARVGQL